MQKLFLRSVIFLALFLCNTLAQAKPILAADYAGGGTELNYPFATGWEFSVTTDITVTMLGVYDLSEPGLADEHNVGIFRKADSTSVVSATIESGVGAAFLPGTFAGTRLAEVAPTTLFAGVAYYLLADNWSNDSYALDDSSVTFASEIVWNGFVDSDFNDINTPPLFLGGVPGNVGGNFTYTVSTVSLPGQTALLCLGLFLLARHRRTLHSSGLLE